MHEKKNEKKIGKCLDIGILRLYYTAHPTSGMRVRLKRPHVRDRKPAFSGASASEKPR